MSEDIEQPRFTCALGAQQTVVAIKRAVPVLHSGPGCSNKINGVIGQGEGYAGGSTIPCTNAGESEIVFGGESRLSDVLDGALKVIDADLYVILTGCTSDIVGDDIANVAERFVEKEAPVVYVETGGFKSNNYQSHEDLVNAIVDQYVERHRDTAGVRPGLVNVFATVPYQDPFWKGNLAELKRILTGIGYQVNILFGAESEGLSEWRSIPNAQFNIVIGPWVGMGIARHLKEKYATPYFHFPYMPVGGKETSRFLRKAAVFGGLAPEAVEEFIKKEEARFYADIEQMASFVLEFRYGLPRKFYSILDASFSIGVSKYLLNELGIIPATQFITDDTPEEFQEAIREQFRHISDRRSAEVVFETNGGAIQEQILQEDHTKRSLLLGSAWEKPLAKEINADLLIVSVPIQYRLIMQCCYAGYVGGLRMAEDIFTNALSNFC